MLTVLVDVVVKVIDGVGGHAMRQWPIGTVAVATGHVVDALWANCQWAGKKKEQDITLWPHEQRAQKFL